MHPSTGYSREPLDSYRSTTHCRRRRRRHHLIRHPIRLSLQRIVRSADRQLLLQYLAAGHQSEQTLLLRHLGPAVRHRRCLLSVTRAAAIVARLVAALLRFGGGSGLHLLLEEVFLERVFHSLDLPAIWST